MEITYERPKTYYPLPGICVFGVFLAVLANQAFKQNWNLMGQAFVVCTVVVAIVAFLTALSLSDSRALPGRAWTAKDVRNYSRIVRLLCKVATVTLGSCMLLLAAAAIASIGETGLATIVCGLGVFTFGLALFTYLQGPADPIEY
jgi:heme/copper-type cytochrome/quinol oxidase subunit 2